MKKYFFIFLTTGIPLLGYSQEIKISYKSLPAVVVQNFRSSYPNARIIGASKETDKGKTVYEVSCKDSSAKRTISFNADGKLIESEELITIDKLPDAVTNAIGKQYAKNKIMKIEKSVKDSKTVYEVLLRDKKKKFEVVLSPDGSIIHQ